MESFKLWFQDWVDACTYARECAPDLSFFAPQAALIGVAVACYLLYRANEHRLRRSAAANDAPGANVDDLKQTLAKMQDAAPARKAA